MDIDDLFKVLKPILGDRTRALWMEYWLHPESRRDIEAMLRVLASRHLGKDFDRLHALLPPPAPEVASGDYPLGTVWYGDSKRYTMGLRENEWIQHVGIYGRTGSGKTGDRDQSDIWTIARPSTSEAHPTMKPLELVERAIENSSRPGDTVLDLFLGSGTTLIAAERTGRVCYGLEIDPHYCRIAIARWEAFTGEQAERLETQ